MIDGRNRFVQLLLGVSVCSSTSAAEIVGTGPIPPDSCSLLAQEVVVRLSASVSGAWVCNEADRNIKVAACSRYGSLSPATITCAAVGLNADGTPRFNVSGCSGDTSQSIEVAGPRAYVASLWFPASVAVGLGAVCSDQTILTVDFLEED